jgi:replicative DNA helicase
MTARYDDRQAAKMNGALERLRNAPIAIDEQPYMPVSLMESRTRRFRSEFGGVDLVIVDYLQYLAPSEGKRHGSRREEVTDIARALKQLARTLSVPVLALSQLSRNVEHRQDKRPILSDLYESGGIEAEADIVSFLYRPSYYAPPGEADTGEGDGGAATPVQSEFGGTPDETEFIVAKNRNGPVGHTKLCFLPEITRFDDIAPEGVF